MAYDVDDAAVWCADEEPAHAPRFCRDRAHDLVAESSSFFVSTVDVVVWTEITESSRAVASRVTSWTLAPVAGEVKRATHPMSNSSAQAEVVGVEALAASTSGTRRLAMMRTACMRSSSCCCQRTCMMPVQRREASTRPVPVADPLARTDHASARARGTPRSSP